MLVIEPGELSATFDVQVYEDDAEEGDETFAVGIALAGSSVARATLGSPIQHTITLVNHTPSTTITLGAAPQRVNESAGETTVSLTATLDEDPFNTDTTIQIEIGDDSETEDSDFTGLEPFDFVIPAGSTSHTVVIAFTPNDDDLDENPETLYIEGEFTATDDGESPLTVSRTSVTITDDDTKGVTLTPLTLTLVEAGSAASYRVRLDSEPFGDVTIEFDVEDNDHLVIVPSQLTFTRENCDTEQRVRVSANDDGDTEPTTNATATISHTASGGRYGDVAISNVAVTIAEATPVVDGSNARANERDGSIEFTASMTASFATESVSIIYSTVDGSAIANEDYTPVTDATLTFLPGETEKAITITLVDDNVDESNENFSLIVTESSGLAGLARGATTLTPRATIADDDPAAQLSQSSQATAENLIFVSESAGEVSVAISLDTVTNRMPSVDYETVTLTQAGAENADAFPEATRGDDYTYVAGTVAFAVGADSVTVTIPIIDDQESEETEYFALLLRNAYRLLLGDEETTDEDGEVVAIAFGELPAGVTGGTPPITNVGIYDSVREVVVSFDAGTYTVAEGEMVAVTVSLDMDPQRQVLIPLTKTEQSGIAGSDYGGAPSSVTFVSGETSKTFTFSATDDTADDEGESVGIGFGTLPAGVSAGSVTITTFTITDEDDPEVTVSFSAAMFGVSEGATVTVTVTLDKDPERQEVVPSTATRQNGATAADYSGIPANVTFESGETSKNFTFTATEGAGFIISLAITDNDETQLVVSPTSLSVQEGETGSYTLKLATRPTGAVTVEVTGHDETDLILGTTTFMFDRDTWDTLQTVTFTAGADDDAVNDTVNLAHTVSGADYAGLVTDDVTVTVEDTDTVGVIVSDTTLEVIEGEEVEYKVKLASEPTSEVTVDVTVQVESKVSLRKRSLSFTKESWNVEQLVPVQARNDEDSSNDEESIRHRVRGGECQGIPADSVLVTITDDDIPVAVSFNSATYTVAEGGSVTVTVDLDVDPERTVTIPLTATNEDGASNGDYSGVPNLVTFDSGEQSKTITFSATDDSEDDDGEQVRLTFATLPAGVSAGTDDETVVSITDDDVPEVIVTPDTVPVPEGRSGRYSVVLSTVPAGTVTVTVTDPADNTDVTAEPADLTFTSSNWESPQYVTVSAIEDDDFIDDTATVTHTVSGYGSVIDASSVTVTVNDDESAVALVTNLGKSMDGTYTFGANHRVLVTFRTGLHAPGYVFTGLVFDVQTATPTGMMVSVVLAEYDRGENARSNPVTLTGEFTATGEVSITPASPVVLSRNQWYIVLIQSSYSGALTGSALGQLSATSSNAETTQPEDTNWVIGNDRSDTDLDDLSNVQVNTQTLRFAVQGGRSTSAPLRERRRSAAPWWSARRSPPTPPQSRTMTASPW